MPWGRGIFFFPLLEAEGLLTLIPPGKAPAACPALADTEEKRKLGGAGDAGGCRGGGWRRGC